MLKFERNPEREQAITLALNESNYYRHMGMRIVEFNDRGSLMELTVEPFLLNAMEIAHGGSIAGLIDASTGTACIQANAEGELSVTLDLKVQIYQATKDGLLTAHGRAVHRTRRYIIGESEVYNEREELVARGSCIHAVID